jgi:hypothetical protein
VPIATVPLDTAVTQSSTTLAVTAQTYIALSGGVIAENAANRTTVHVGAGTALPITNPGFAAGSFLLATYVSISSATAPTAPAGWVLLGSSTAGTNREVYAWGKIATGSEPGTYNFVGATGGFSDLVVFELTASAGDLAAVAATAAATNGSTANLVIPMPSLSVTAPGSAVFFAGVESSTGETLDFGASYTTVNFNRLHVGFRLNTPTGTISAFNVTHPTPTSTSAGFGLVLAPVAVAQSSAALNLTAPTQLALGAAAATSSATLALMAATKVPLQPSAATATASLTVTGSAVVVSGGPGGKTVLRDVWVVVNGVDLSNHARQVDLSDTTEQIDVTSYSSAGQREFLPGLRDATITVEFFSDQAASNVDAVLRPLHVNGATALIEVRPTSGAASATNPSAVMIGQIVSYKPIGGAVGDAAIQTAVFRNADDQEGIVIVADSVLYPFDALFPSDELYPTP